MSRYPDAKPSLRYVPKIKAASNDADDAIHLSTGYGLVPDLWQAALVKDWMGRRRDGKWCAGKCGVSIPRQNGKNGALEIRELFGMIVLGEAFLHTAHEVKTARKAFKRLKYFFGEKADDPDARFPELNALVDEVRNTNGQEAIFLKDVWEVDGSEVRSKGRPRDEWGDPILHATFIATGGSIEIAARSSGSGRGWTVDVLILDEAQHLSDDEIEALLSTVSSAPLRNPQVYFLGTPPNPDKGQTGEVFRRVRNLVFKGQDKRLSWVEYGAPDGPMPDIEDDALLWAVNPGLVNGRLQTDVIDDERSILSDAGFARERYGWWGDNRKGVGSIFGSEWAACAIEPIPAKKRPEIVGLGVGVARGMKRAAIVAARLITEGADDGRILLDPLEQLDHGDGTAVRVKELQDLHQVPVVISEDCPDPNLAEALAEEGVDATVLPRADWIAAISTLYQEVHDGSIAHEHSTALDDAVDAASWRPGDRLIVDRRGGDVAALEAAIGAHHAAAEELSYDVEDSLL